VIPGTDATGCPGHIAAHFHHLYLGDSVARDRAEALNSYITDMLALEEHIEKAIKGQIKDLKDDPEFVREIQAINRTVEHHISDLKGLVDRRDAGGPVDAIKKVGSNLAGLGAAAIDLVRTEGTPKNLRDDYTAFSLATISYVMLHTTALATGDTEVSDLARQHFIDYAQVVTRLNQVVPAAVLRLLQREGLAFSDAVLNDVNRTVEEGWSRTEASRTAVPPTTPVL
jgi:ferritin-like metal-binding protein YciE